MGKQIKKQSFSSYYQRRGGSILIEIRDADMRKIDTYKFGLEDKKLGNRIFLEISEKYNFVMPIITEPVEEHEPSILFDDNEGEKNKEFLQQLGDKIFTNNKKEAKK